MARTTVTLGGRGGRTISIDDDLTEGLDTLGERLAERLGAPPSRSVVATILVLDSGIDATEASADEIRTVVKAALTVRLA